MITFLGAKNWVFVMKKAIAICIGLSILIAWSVPSFAQESREDDPIILDQKEKQKEREEIDKRYKATLQKTRKEGPAERMDPWANMRGASTSEGKR